MRKKLCATIVFLLVLNAVLPHIQAPATEVEAQSGPQWVLVERGANFERYQSSSDPTIYRWMSAPQWVHNGSEYVPYIYQDQYAADGYYQVQTGLVAARIYDYYAVLYNPNMTEVRLYDERWEVQKWKTTGQGGWENLGAQSGTPTFSILQSESHINITKSFHSWAGWLNVTYVFHEGSALKHEAVFKSEIGSTETFRVMQKWAGIVGDRVRHRNGSQTISSAVTINSTWFQFCKPNWALTVFEDQYAMANYLEPATVDVHAQGMKVDFSFSNWTLSLGESLTVDPATTTLEPPLADAKVREDTPTNNFGSTLDLIIQSSDSGDYRTFIKFDISSLPVDCALSQVLLKLYLGGNSATNYHQWILKVVADWAENTITWNNQPASGIKDWHQFIMTSGTGWKTFDVSDRFKCKDDLTYGFMLRFETEGDALDPNWWAHSKEYTYDPKLEVTYSTTVKAKRLGGALQSSAVTKDADIYQASPDTNYGSAATMMVYSQATGYNRRVLVEFDISSIGSVINATLRLCITQIMAAAEGRTYDVHRVTGSWTEAGVTWNNQPSVDGSVHSHGTGPSSSADETYWEINVTDSYSSGSVIGFRLKDQSEDSSSPYPWIEFVTRNHAESFRHSELLVVYTPNEAPTNDACDSDAAFDVDVYGWVNMTVMDPDGVADLKTVEIQITTYESKTFTLRWTQSTNVFSEVSDASGICTLDESGSTRINIDSDTDKIAFHFRISAGAQKGSCNVEATTSDDSDAADQDTYTDEFSINFYISITVDDSTHGWTNLNPGDTDALLTSPADFDIDLTVTANAPFSLQGRGKGNLVHNNINETGQVLKLDLEEGTGSTIYDGSGQGNDGALLNSPTWIDGKYNKGLYLDGDDDSVRVDDDASLNFDGSTSFSVEMWIRGPASHADWARIFEKGGAQGWRAYRSSGAQQDRLRFRIQDGLGNYVVNNFDAIFDDDWHHVVFIVDRSVNEVRFYKDAVKNPTEYDCSGVGDLTNAANLRFGTTDTGGNPNRMDIDEVRIYNRALSPQEIGEHYHLGPIPVGNIKIHKDTLASAVALTGVYTDIGGLPNQPRGENLAKSFKLWISVPNPCEDGTYTYTLSIQGVEYV